MMKIFREISYADVARIAILLEAETDRETAAGLAALTHVIRNRIVFGEHFSNIIGDPDFDGHAVRQIGGQSLGIAASFEMLSLIAAIFEGNSEDPTDGAVRFHRHDKQPGWAKELQPTALIGGRFYYV